MGNIILNRIKVSFVKEANGFIFFIKRIPLVGKRIPDKLYKLTNLKVVLGIISLIFTIMFGFIKKAAYLGLMVLLPAFLISNLQGELQPIFLQIFFTLSLIMGPLIKPEIFSFNENAFNMIILMRCESKVFYLSEIIFKNIIDFIHFILPLSLIGIIVGYSPSKALMLILYLICFRILAEAFYVFIYSKTKIILVKNNFYSTIIIILGLALAYGLPLLGFIIDFKMFLFNIGYLILVICLTLGVYFYLSRYKKFKLISKEILNRGNYTDINKIMLEAKFADAKLDEKVMAKEELNTKVYDNKDGFEYLNSILFLRFKRIILRPIIRRLVIIGIAFLVCVYVVMFIPHGGKMVVDYIIDKPAVFVFVMYILSTGERIAKIMFFNCDVALLKYNYYRQPKVILSNFTLRLKKVIFLNLLPAVAICIGIIILTFLSGYGSSLYDMIPLLISIIILACFFSIHHLFLYYVIQPYTAGLTVKSPLFSIINFIIYILSYFSLQIEKTPYFFTMVVISGTVVYMVVALILTYVLAPKTFKLRV